MAVRKIIHVNGIALSYLERNETAALTIFFLHGNSGSALAWQKQFDSPVLAGYRLIAFDLPGHGQSAPITADENILLNTAAVLAGAVQQLSKGQPFVLVGLSLGTNVAAEMLAQGVQPAGIVLLGSCVLGSGYTLLNIGIEGADLTPLFSESADESSLLKCLEAACHCKEETIRQQLTADYRATEPTLRPAFLQSGLQERYSDEIFLLKQAGVPLLVIFGADEEAINPHYLDDAGLPLWQEKIFKLPGGSHFIQLDQPAAVNSLLQAYTEQAVTGSRSARHSSAVR